MTYLNKNKRRMKRHLDSKTPPIFRGSMINIGFLSRADASVDARVNPIEQFIEDHRRSFVQGFFHGRVVRLVFVFRSGDARLNVSLLLKPLQKL